jgi:TolA-binding protein
MTTPKLYEIAHDFRTLFDAIAQFCDDHPDLDEVSKQAIFDENLASLQQDFDSKALALAGYIQNLKLEQTGVKEVQDRLAKRLKQLDRTIAHLNGYLLMQMQQVNVSKLSNSWLTIQVKTNPCKVIIDDESALSEEFKTLEQVIKINKSAISEQLKAGVIVAHAHLEQSQRVEIK